MRVRGCRVRRSAQAQHATVLCGSAVGQGFEGFSRRSRSRKCEQLPAALTAKLLRAAFARHHRRVVDATRRALPCRGRVKDMTLGATIRGICLATSGPGILRPQHLCVAFGTQHRAHEGVFHGLLPVGDGSSAAAMEPASTHGRHEDTRSGIAQGALWTKRPGTVHSCGGDLTRATQCHKQPGWSDTVPGERRRPTGGTLAISTHPASEGRTRAASEWRQRRFPPALCCAAR